MSPAHSEVTAFSQWVTRLEALPGGARTEIAHALSSQALELQVNATEQCNFRCTYCYENFAVGRMSEQVQNNLRALITKQMTNRSRLYLNWFGGEPLIAADIVEAISRHAQKVCGEVGAQFYSGVTTNGYNLTPTLMQTLMHVGIGFFQVTLDGDGSGHDQYRKRADGMGTFSQIWNNILDLRESSFNFRMLVRVHLRPGCRESVQALLARFQNEIADDDRFEIAFHQIRDLGGPLTGTFPILGEDDTTAMFKDFARIATSKVSLIGVGIEDEATPKPEGCGLSVCYACKPNAFLIRADGRVGKCTVVLDASHNAVGTLGDGGILHLDRAAHSKWTNSLVTLDPQHLSCPAQRGPSHFSA